jgi:hypothetical protein
MAEKKENARNREKELERRKKSAYCDAVPRNKGRNPIQ